MNHAALPGNGIGFRKYGPILTRKQCLDANGWRLEKVLSFSSRPWRQFFANFAVKLSP
jgi:hypothetical protein